MTTTDNPAPLPGANTSIGQTLINRWRAFALLAVAFFMVVVDLTIVNTRCQRSAAICTSRPRTCNGW
jgi:hypothetical protein